MTISTSKNHDVYLDGKKLFGTGNVTIPTGAHREVWLCQGESTGKTTDFNGTIGIDISSSVKALKQSMKDISDFSMAASKAFKELYVSLDFFMVSTCISHGQRLPGSIRTKRLRKKRSKAARVWFYNHLRDIGE